MGGLFGIASTVPVAAQHGRINYGTKCSMSLVAWDAGRTVRGELDQEFPFRISVKCRCGRSLGFVYGFADRACRRYWKGYVPFTVVSNAPMQFKCHRRCGVDYRLSWGMLQAAYQATLAKPEDNRVLVLPYDLHGLKPVPRRMQPVRSNGAFIGR